jgi:chitooligosaccharide deacetylase
MLLEVFNGRRTAWRMPQRPGERTVYLTYDDGPNPNATPALLDLLAREGVPATFFVIDRHLTPDTAPIVRRMFDEGHTVGLHSHTRAKMFMTPARLGEVLVGAADRIERLAGRPPCRAFRPHGGGRSGLMYAGLARIDYTLVGWSFGAWDKELFGSMRADRISRRLIERAAPGTVFVIHDGHHKNPRADRQYAIDTTATLIPELRRRGFSFGRICRTDGRVGP